MDCSVGPSYGAYPPAEAVPAHVREIVTAAARTASVFMTASFQMSKPSHIHPLCDVTVVTNCALIRHLGRHRQSILEHVAGVDDFEVAEATYRAAVARWPLARITLRQGARVVYETPTGRSG